LKGVIGSMKALKRNEWVRWGKIGGGGAEKGFGNPSGETDMGGKGVLGFFCYP